MADYLYEGIDLSKHNGSVNFTQVKNAGYKFVILRAGYGKLASQKDSKFDEFYKAATEAGLEVGAYWYSYATTAAEATLEAKACISVLDGKKLSYPLYYDVEESDVLNSSSKSVLTSIVNTFCKAVAAEGYTAGFYTFASATSKFNIDEINYEKWLAKWSSSMGSYSSSEWCMWQHGVKGSSSESTISGSVPGCTNCSAVDVDYTYKDYTTVTGVSFANTTSTTSSSSSTTSSSSSIIAPYKGSFRVSQIFKGSEHQGIDLVGVTGKNLYATFGGKVEVASNADPNGFGIYVRIKITDSGDYKGYVAYYGHMSSVAVNVGDTVVKGQLIGVEGSTGKSTGSHCHYEIRKSSSDHDSYQDINAISNIPNATGTYTSNLTIVSTSSNNTATTSNTSTDTSSTKTTSTTTSNTSSSSSSLSAGTKITLNKVNLYASASSSSATSTKTGTFYIYSSTVTNGRIRITNSSSNVGKTPAGNYVTGWVKVSDITTTTSSSSTSTTSSSSSTTSTSSSSSGSTSLKAGSKVTLKNTKLYASASASTSSGTKTGTFYIYSATITNNRIRITNSSSNVGKTPAGNYVTGWVKVSDIS